MLGWERESSRKPAGLRTHMMVAIASALFTVLAELAVSVITPTAGARSAPIPSEPSRRLPSELGFWEAV